MHTYIHIYLLAYIRTYMRTWTDIYIICLLGVLSVFRTTHYLNQLTFCPMLSYPQYVIFTQVSASFSFPQPIKFSRHLPFNYFKIHFNTMLPSVFLPSNFLLPSDFHTKSLCVFRFSLMRPTSAAPFSPHIITLTIFSDEVILTNYRELYNEILQSAIWISL